VAESAFGPVVAASETEREDLVQRAERLGESVAELSGEITTLQGQLVPAEEQHALEHQLSAKDKQIRELVDCIKLMLVWIASSTPGGGSSQGRLDTLMQALDSAEADSIPEIAAQGLERYQAHEMARLQEEYDARGNEAEALRSEVQSLGARLGDESAERERLAGELTHETRAREEALQHRAALEAEIESLRTSDAAARVESESLRTSEVAARAESESLRTSEAAARAESESLRSSEVAARAESERVAVAMAELAQASEARHAQLEASLAEQRSELEQQATAQGETFEQRLAEQGGRLEASQAAVREHTEARTRSRVRLAEMVEKLSQQDAEAGQLRRELAEQHAVLAGREEALRRNEAEVDGLRTRHDEDKSRFERTTRKLRDAEALTRGADHDRDLLHEQLAARTTALQQARETSAARLADLESLQARCDDLTRDLDEKEQEVRRLAAAANVRDEDREAHEQRIRALELELETESTTAAQLRDRVLRLEDELAGQRREVTLAYGEVQRLHGIASRHGAPAGERKS
jgi:chromosome segregation ATPase